MIVIGSKILMIIWRMIIVARNTKAVLKGIGAGLAAGIMAGLVSSVVMKDSRKNKKRFSKAIGSVENVLDSMQEIFS